MRKKIISAVAAACVIGWCALVARHVVRSLVSDEAAEAASDGSQDTAGEPQD